MRRSCLLLSGALLLCSAGCRKSGTPPAKTWYDAAPLLESLRAEERAGAARLLFRASVRILEKEREPCGHADERGFGGDENLAPQSAWSDGDVHGGDTQSFSRHEIGHHPRDDRPSAPWW